MQIQVYGNLQAMPDVVLWKARSSGEAWRVRQQLAILI